MENAMDSTPVTLENIVEEHQKLIKAIYDYDYFVVTYERAKNSFILDLSSPPQICEFWYHFWRMLPTTETILRPPFYRVCDLAEGSYLYKE
jgi:hypothetical protein